MPQAHKDYMKWEGKHWDSFMRNGRWGTCGSCPHDGSGRVLPELCKNTSESDHNLTLEQLVQHYHNRVSK